MPCSWIGRVNTVKLTTLPKAIYRIKCNPYQITNDCFHRIKAKYFIICMVIQNTLNSQSNLEKEKWNWKNQAPRLQTILQSYSNQERNIDQGNKIENPEINQHIYSHLIYDKGVKNMQWRKDSLFSE